MSNKTKPTAKKAPKLAPIILTGKTCENLSGSFLHMLIERRTSKQLAEDLRCRSIPIPKNKDEAITRLVSWLSRAGGTFTLELR